MWWWRILAWLGGLAAAVAIGVIVVKIIDKPTVKKNVNEELKKHPEIVGAIKAKIKKTMKNAITLDILDSWDSIVVPDVEIRGEAVADDIHVGDEIIL